LLPKETLVLIDGKRVAGASLSGNGASHRVRLRGRAFTFAVGSQLVDYLESTRGSRVGFGC